MFVLAAGSALIGFILGFRFRVLVLIPITMIGTAALIFTGGLLLGPSSSIVAAIIVFATSLQVGYAISGCLAHATTRPRRLARPAGPLGLKLR